ncbi:uncharacterized protein LOC132722741 [Ruditapes philippinarum]|uniref:uncharacterized protein LOC132722741 n=1 Tax=Ruditapes philippinarum TaxID=129788 RepID=UPI00295AEC29|nr:uncharacterized protein LOC132722741 [Ruditapes philippinarum]
MIFFRPIPKKMKRLIDGDLASLRDIRKMSTRDRLKEKLKERQNQSQNALESKVNAAEETSENGLNKLKRQRKRKKKSKRSDESPSVYLNNEHDKDVTKEENCHQHCENTHVKQHHTSDEAEKNNENMISKVQLEKTNKGHEEVAATSKVEKEAYDPKVDDTEFTKTNAADGNCI